jgi:hypothetical protein
MNACRESLAGALFLAGCHQEPSQETPTVEIRGEPIRTTAPRPTTPSAATVAPVATNSKPEAQLTKSAEDNPYPLVGFDKLSGYPIEISDEILGPVTNNLDVIAAKTEALIPQNVKAFDRQHASIKGFMLPLKVEGGVVTELLIMKDQSMCCYGAVPKIHEWVSVKMTAGVKPIGSTRDLFGTLRVGEMRENGICRDLPHGRRTDADARPGLAPENSDIHVCLHWHYFLRLFAFFAAMLAPRSPPAKKRANLLPQKTQ